ncbi:hypothetical protein D3C86_1257840 [compost metagenome]
MFGHHAHHGFGQYSGAAQGQGADLHHALQGTAQCGDIGLDVAQFVQRPADRKENFVAGAGWLQPAGRTLEQRLAAPAFHHFDSRADGRLAQAKQAGYGLHVPGFAELDEHLQASGLKQVQRLDRTFVRAIEQSRHTVEFGQHATCPRQQALAETGQAHAVGVAFEQWHIELGLQLGDRPGHH